MTFHRALTLRHSATAATPVLVGEAALAAAEPELLRWLAGRAVFVVGSAPVLALHGARLDGLRAAAARWEVLEVADGEAAKSVRSAEALWNRMLAAGGKRDSRVIAFGGGSVGDLAGFAAGCFLRGLDFVQIPTTLLAQVDAAIGGKTGVDLPGGKNTVGLFHHPAMVVCDTSLLPTLPRGELRSGLVEVIKMAALLDLGLLAETETALDALLAGEAAALGPVVAGAAAASSGGVVSTSPDTTPFRRASISSCERILSMRRRLLNDEIREIGGPHTRLGKQPIDPLRNLIAQLKFPLSGSHRIHILTTEQHKDGVTDLGNPCRQIGRHRLTVDLKLDGQLQVTHVRHVGQIHNERIQVEHHAGGSRLLSGRLSVSV